MKKDKRDKKDKKTLCVILDAGTFEAFERERGAVFRSRSNFAARLIEEALREIREGRRGSRKPRAGNLNSKQNKTSKRGLNR